MKRRLMFVFLALVFVVILLSASSTCVYANTQNSYKAQWAQWAEQSRKGDYKSQEITIRNIYNQASREKNAQQKIKALLYLSAIAWETHDENVSENKNPTLDVFNDFRKNVDEAKGLEKSVLQSYLAQMYATYKQQSQWKRQSITNTNKPSTDFQTWTDARFDTEIDSLFQLSLMPQEQLQKERTSDWRTLLVGDDEDHFSPTLYDVLSRSYLQYLTYNYPVKQIAKINELYLNLIQFHKNDADLTAYLRYNADYIQAQTTSQEQKDTAMLDIIHKNMSQPYTAKLIADVSSHLSNLQAHTLCLKGERISGKWAAECKNTLQMLEKREVELAAPQKIYPQNNIALQITHKNENKFVLNIYKADPIHSTLLYDKQVLNYSDGNILYRKQTDTKPFRTDTVTLHSFSDYSTHTTLHKLEGLSEGVYIIQAIVEKTPRWESADTSFTVIQVGKVAALPRNEKTTQQQLVDSHTGKALGNVDGILYSRDYNENGRGYKMVVLQTLKTNANGIFTMKKPYSMKTLFLYLPSFNEYVYLEPSNSSRRSDWQEDSVNQVNVQFFTDRAIYRPGQKVYFKGIVTHEKSDAKNQSNALVTHKKVEVSLRNTVNDAEIAKMDLVTNDFGSVFGTFILPVTAITGDYELVVTTKDVEGNYNFKVEEYKRPKFAVQFDTVKNEFMLDHPVFVSGKAAAYSGANISGAKVSYRIVRRETWLWNYLGCWNIPRAFSETEIANGTLQTDADGKFTIHFNALTTRKQKDKEYRAYIYSIVADVLDLNGETHSAAMSVTIGDLPRTLYLDIPQKTDQKNLKVVKIVSQSLNGADAVSQGTLTITQLQEPTRIFTPHRQEKWDYVDYDYATFAKYFPHLSYKDETNPNTFKKLGVVLKTDFNTALSDSVNIHLNVGCYLVEAYTLSGKDSIQTQQIIYVLDNQTHQTVPNDYFSASLDKSDYYVGDTATLCIHSDAQDGYVNLYVERNDSLCALKQLKLEHGKAECTFKITESDLSHGLYINVDWVKWNDWAGAYFTVPISKKMKYAAPLNISTQVFRDKIDAGKQEKWTLLIQGDTVHRTTCEVLATLYDASLDAFAENTFPDVLEEHYFYKQARYIHGGNLFLPALCSNSSCGVSSLATAYATDSRVIGTYSPSVLNWFHFTPRVYESPNDRGPVLMRANYDVDIEQDEAFVIVPSKSVASGAFMMKSVVASEAPQANDIKPLRSLPKEDLSQIQSRKHLQETAFFYPNLYTDHSGLVHITFTAPESLTKWKLLLFAHNKNLQYATAQYTTQTQKELMVVPNVPRFLREGDEVKISTKINNLSHKDLDGSAVLSLFDAMSNKPVDSLFNLKETTQTFHSAKGENTQVTWTLKVPQNISAVNCRIVAKSGEFSDGEDNVLPIVPNRMMLTETLPLSIREGETKTFKLNKLINGNNHSNSLQNFSLTMEMTTNPTWMAVMALPYLREFPYECSEQLFSRLYGNVLSAYIINSSPKIKRVFDEWNSKGMTQSNLEKNAELKSLLLTETPWLHDAQDESEQMKRIAVFFDLNTMKNELLQAQNKLMQRQNDDGSFCWFEKGGDSNPYITGCIVAGFGQLKRLLGEKQAEYISEEMQTSISRAISYLDYDALRQIELAKKEHYGINPSDFAHYFYVRSYWKDRFELPGEVTQYLKPLLDTYVKEGLTYSLQQEAFVATILQRYGRPLDAQRFIHNIKEKSVESNEMGMYWKDNKAGWYWYQTPVETQAALIEAVSEVTPQDTKSIEAMKVWLIKNKQTNHWASTKATTEAIYALMSYGKSWLDAEQGVTISVGEKSVYPHSNTDASISAQEASGYVKKVWSGSSITPDMGVVTIAKTSPGVAYGGLYWQYFDDFDKITEANTDIHLEKELFIKTNTPTGPLLNQIKADYPIRVGDVVTVRLIIKTDREMDYIHIKDMRASGFEPINVMSTYKWQNGASYYESTRDASTDFFFAHFNKGTYTFEYDVRANNAGVFSNGITLLENMYAPEMSAHSAGLQVNIKSK